MAGHGTPAGAQHAGSPAPTPVGSGHDGVADDAGACHVAAVGGRSPVFREGGFSVEEAAHAISTVDSYVHGFVLQEVNLPFRNESELAAMTGAIMDQFPRADFPYLFELTTEHVLKTGYNYANEFDVGLEAVLDGVDARLRRARR